MLKVTKLSLGQQILFALVLGIGTGLFFGEFCAHLNIVGDAVIQLIQMTVLPYILLSLIHGIGRLNITSAKNLAQKAGIVLLTIWGLGLTIILIMPTIFPTWDTASFYSKSFTAQTASVNFLDIYIPANIFYSLSQNFVPAIVIFSVLGGVALIFIQKKEPLLEQLDIWLSMLGSMTNYTAALLPIGIFAIAANAAGTMRVEELDRLTIYFSAYLLAAGLLTFWIIPMLVTLFTPIRYKDIFNTCKDALITAFAAGNLFIVLPILGKNGKDLLKQYDLNNDESEATLDIILAVIFCFPLLGKLILMTFTLFAGWYSGNAIQIAQYPLFALSGLFSFFGHDVVATSFLMDLFKIPQDFFQLYMLTTIVSGRFSTLLDAVCLLTVMLVGTCLVHNFARVQKRQVLKFAISTLIIVIVTVTGANWALNTFVHNTYNKDELLANMQLTQPQVEAVVHRAVPASDNISDDNMPLLKKIRNRGVLRVGYNPDHLPYNYFNGKGDLVGFNIDMAHMLARDMGVKLEFIPVEKDTMRFQLELNQIDIVMAGLELTPLRLLDMTFSDPYLYADMAIVVKDHMRNAFSEVKDIRDADNLTIHVTVDPYIVEILRQRLPNANIAMLDTNRNFFEEPRDDMEVLFTTAEEGSAWCLLFPKYQILVPQGVQTRKSSMAYPIANPDPSFKQFLNQWIGMNTKHNATDHLYQYWVYGEGASIKLPRWCIARNVLGLMK